MRIHISLPTAFCCILSVTLSLLPPARGTPISGLVFTVSSATQVTETLNGALIGSWSWNSGLSKWSNMDANSYGGLVGATTLVFLDPLDPGHYDVFQANSLFSDYTAAQVNNTFSAVDYPHDPALATSFLPFTQTGAEVIVPFNQGLFADVNITVQGIPDRCSTCGLMILGGIALAVARKQLGDADAANLPSVPRR